jgi:iron complex outermembrane recepter protein
MSLSAVRRLLLSTVMATAMIFPMGALEAQENPAQSSQPASDPQANPSSPSANEAQQQGPAIGPAAAEEQAIKSKSQSQEIVITGSRIRRAHTDTPSPVLVVDQQAITDRGFVSAAGALNQVTSITPALNIAPGNGDSSGTGQQFPNLFGLGPGRTLTLVNGRRFVTSSVGLGDSEVDANIIPTGLIDRIEVVQAGGSVVYGSDAIAGVVNYILKDHFQGVELDAQNSFSTYGDYPVYSLRGTAGKNFDGGRGNVAVNVEWSKSQPLAYADRPRSNLSRVTESNPADTGPNDGIPSVEEVLDARFWEFNNGGVIFTIPAPVPIPPCGFQICFARVNGQPLQFGAGDSLLPYDPGNILGVPFAQGGEGFRFADLVGLETGVERLTGNLVAHYDLTNRIKLSTELLYADTKGTQMPQGFSRTILNSQESNSGYILFTRNNPFLTSQEIATLSAASPGFAFGAPLFLSKYFTDLLKDGGREEDNTKTYRGLVSLDGNFDVGWRNFYWSISGSYGQVNGSTRQWNVNNQAFNNAIDAVRDSGGNIVCAINADNDSTNDDPACAALNPFGIGNVSEAARDYVNVLSGTDFTNKQTDLLATLGGSLINLPAGELKFSAAYEHRDESAKFVPLAANQLGIINSGTPEIPQSGKYNTNELSGELLLPIVGGDFTLPLVRSLEIDAAARHVSNSLAGIENLWSIGARWEAVRGITLRASRSRNFRAPTLTQLVAPSVSGFEPIAQDPCDADRINSGPNPQVRRASCLALFEANPGYGVLSDGSNAGASAEARLANFQDPAENFAVALVTTGGNPNLKSEISKTLTYGVVLQPVFVPGLTFVADRIQIDLKNGLSPFQTEDFAAACYDNTNPPPGICDAFSRLSAPSGNNVGGTIIAGTTTTFNAGVVKFRGEVYNLTYNFPLSRLFGGGNAGRLELNLEATHTSLFETSVTGETFVRTDNTIFNPDWVGRFDAIYTRGPFRLTYQLIYRDRVKHAADATIENDPNPIVKRNIIQNVSVQREFGPLTLRAGVLNLFNEPPSYPTISYGDIIGRQIYVGARLKF